MSFILFIGELMLVSILLAVLMLIALFTFPVWFMTGAIREYYKARKERRHVSTGR